MADDESHPDADGTPDDAKPKDGKPKIALTGMAQLISTSLSTLFSGHSVELTGSAALRFPLLDWGGARRRSARAARGGAQAYLPQSP